MTLTSEELRAYRLRLGETQKEIAVRTGYSISYIQKLEQGRLEITPEFMERLNKAYNIEANFRRSYEQPKEKFDWGRVILFILFLLFIFCYMQMNR